MNRLSLDKQEQIIAALVEGGSVRGTARSVKVTPNTILRNLLWIGEACQKLHDERVRHLKGKCVQADELWNFIYAKDKGLPKRLKGSKEVGDMWTWVSIDPESRLIPCWRIGKHEMIDADLFMTDLASRSSGRLQITTDQLTHYRTAIEKAFGDRVDYATIQKDLKETLKTPDGQFEQPKLKGMRQASVYGNPDPDLVSTSAIESNNMIIRKSMRRYMRRMNGFSRSIRHMKAAFALHVVYHNYCRYCQPIRCTPAIEAKLTDHMWEIEELLAQL